MSRKGVVDSYQIFDEFRIFVISHEIAFALIGAVLILCFTVVSPTLVQYPIACLLLLSIVFIHMSSIGILPNALQTHFRQSLLRGFLMGYSYGFLNGDYQLGLLHAFDLLIPLFAGMIFWFGFFSEFMRRKGFSDWIIVICTSILFTFFLFLLLQEFPSLLFAIIVFTSSILACGIRLRTQSVWDALLACCFLYIISSQAGYVYHLFRLFW